MEISENTKSMYRLRKVLKISVLSLLFVLIGVLILEYFRIKPRDVYFTNVSSSSVTVSWNTKSPISASVIAFEGKSVLPIRLLCLGKERYYDTRDVRVAELEAAQQAGMDRDDLSLTIDNFQTEVKVEKRGKYYTHHVTVKGLEPETEYSFMVGDSLMYKGVSSIVNEESISTLAVPEAIPTPRPVYSSVKDAQNIENTPINELVGVTDGILYFNFLDNVTGIRSNIYSSVLNEDGNWYIDVSDAKDSDGNPFLETYDTGEWNIIGELVIDGGNLGMWKKREVNTDALTPASLTVIRMPYGVDDYDVDGAVVPFESKSEKGVKGVSLISAQTLTTINNNQICNNTSGCICTASNNKVVAYSTYCTDGTRTLLTSSGTCTDRDGCVCNGSNINYNATCTISVALPSIGNNSICNNTSGCNCTISNKVVAYSTYCTDGSRTVMNTSGTCTDRDGCVCNGSNINYNATCSISTVTLPTIGNNAICNNTSGCICTASNNKVVAYSTYCTDGKRTTLTKTGKCEDRDGCVCNSSNINYGVTCTIQTPSIEEPYETTCDFPVFCPEPNGCRQKWSNGLYEGNCACDNATLKARQCAGANWGDLQEIQPTCGGIIIGTPTCVAPTCRVCSGYTYNNQLRAKFVDTSETCTTSSQCTEIIPRDGGQCGDSDGKEFAFGTINVNTGLCESGSTPVGSISEASFTSSNIAKWKCERNSIYVDCSARRALTAQQEEPEVESVNLCGDLTIRETDSNGTLSFSGEYCINNTTKAGAQRIPNTNKYGWSCVNSATSIYGDCIRDITLFTESESNMNCDNKNVGDICDSNIGIKLPKNDGDLVCNTTHKQCVLVGSRCGTSTGLTGFNRILLISDRGVCEDYGDCLEGFSSTSEKGLCSPTIPVDNRYCWEGSFQFLFRSNGISSEKCQNRQWVSSSEIWVSSSEISCKDFVNNNEHSCIPVFDYCYNMKNNTLYPCVNNVIKGHGEYMPRTIGDSKLPATELPIIEAGQKCTGEELENEQGNNACACKDSYDKLVKKGEYCRHTHENGCLELSNLPNINIYTKVCKLSGETCGYDEHKFGCYGEIKSSLPSVNRNPLSINKGISRISAQSLNPDTSDFILDPQTGMFTNIEPGTYVFEYEGKLYNFIVDYYSLITGDGSVMIYLDINNNGTYEDGTDIKVSDIASQVKIVTISRTYSYQLSQGFNFISFPFLIESENSRTAAGLIKNLNNVYGDVIFSISKYDGAWRIVGQNVEIYDNNDFQLIPGQGYIIKAKEDVTITLSGQPVQYDSTSDNAPVTLFTGWNLIGLYGTGTKQYTAKSMIKDINSYTKINFTADNVSRWQSDVQMYDGYQLTVENGIDMEYGFDYPINTLQSYFVRIKEGKGNWQPSLR